MCLQGLRELIRMGRQRTPAHPTQTCTPEQNQGDCEMEVDGGQAKSNYTQWEWVWGGGLEMENFSPKAGRPAEHAKPGAPTWNTSTRGLQVRSGSSCLRVRTHYFPSRKVKPKRTYHICTRRPSSLVDQYATQCSVFFTKWSFSKNKTIVWSCVSVVRQESWNRHWKSERRSGE